MWSERKEIRMQTNPSRGEDEAFVEAVKKNRPEIIRSPYSDALKTLKLTLAADTSLEKGKIISLSNFK